MGKFPGKRKIKEINTYGFEPYMMDAGPAPQGPRWILVLTTIITLVVIIGLLALCYPEVFANLI